MRVALGKMNSCGSLTIKGSLQRPHGSGPWVVLAVGVECRGWKEGGRETEEAGT